MSYLYHFPKEVDKSLYSNDDNTLNTFYGLPKKVSFCRCCVISNQRPSTSVEFKNDKKRLRPNNSEVQRLYGDNTLIKKLTNWEPKYSGIDGFRKGIELTVNWFNNDKNLKMYNPNLYSV